MKLKPILYINGNKVEALLFNTIQLSKEKGVFVGEDERFDQRTGNYEMLEIKVKVDSLGEFKKKRVQTGWKEIIPKRFFNGLRYIAREKIALLSVEEKNKLRRISTTEIIEIIKGMDKNAENWSVFENAVYLIHDRTIHYYREVRRKTYEEVPTGFVINAKIKVWYKGNEYLIRKGTYVSKSDCTGKMVYRFVVPCKR